MSDLEDIMNEVDNYKVDDEEEEEHVNVDELLKDDPLVDQTISMLTDYGDPVHIAELPMPRPDLRNLIDSPEHPLDMVEKHERDISAKLGSQMNLDTKFLVTNFEKNMDKNYMNVSYTVLETISNHCFPDEFNKLPMHSDEYWGAPKCLAVFGQKYIALGTSHAIAIVFDLQDSTAKKLGTQKEQDFGFITTMDLSAKDDCLVCGYESGHVVLWGIMKNENLRTISPIDKCPIMAIKFWKESKHHMIVSNAKGMVHLYKAEYSFFQYNVEKKALLDLSDQGKGNVKGKDPMDRLPDGVFSIQLLKKELTKQHPLQKYTIVALGTMKLVLIVTLDPVVTIVYRFERPPGLSDTVIPCISWGKGTIPGVDDNRHPLLAISWGQELYLFQCQNVEEEDGKGIKFAGYYRSNFEISHLEWLSESNIITYDPSREFKVLYTGLFNTPSGSKQTKSEFDYSAAVINSQLVDPDIGCQIYNNEKTKNEYVLSSSKQRPILYYTNTITANLTTRLVFILGYKKLYLGQHFDWKEYIDNMISDAEWLNALAIITSLSRGSNVMFAGLPSKTQERKQVLKQYGAEIIKKYIRSVNSMKEYPGDDVWKTVILTVIDFLVSIENFVYLFTDIKRLLENMQKQSLFMECLEPFILKGRIKTIPNEAFREIVNYYSEKDKISVLQFLMINIDMTHIDLEFAISLCMEYNLLTALFYFCIHKDDGSTAEYMTPIARALSLYQKSIDDDHFENQEYGLKFLWFVYMIIKGKMFPHGAIPEEVWGEKVKDIIVLLFEEKNLELMFRTQPHVAFEILRALFEPKLATLILSYDDTSIQLIDDKDKLSQRMKGQTLDANTLKYALNEFMASVSNKIQAQMLALIYYCGKKKRQNGMDYQNLMFYMMASLAVHLSYKIPDEVMEESLFYILENERDVPRWEIIRKKYDERNVEEEGNPLIEERNDLILGLLKNLEGKIREEELETVRRMVDQTEFIDVKVYLVGLKRDYKKCFEMYLSQSAQFKLMKVFNWLDDKIKYVKAQDPKQFKSLKEAIVSYLSSLVSINSERTRRIMSSLGESLEADAIRMLEPSPRLQFDYLKGVISQKEEKGEKIEDELLVLYMKLLCQFFPKQVFEEVNRRSYPLDPCLKLCRQFDVKDGLAFFLEKAGNIMEALDISLKLFKATLEKKLKKVEQKGLFDEQSLNIKMKNVKEICWKHSKIGDPDTIKIWFYVLDKMLEGYLTFIVNNPAVQKAIRDRSDSPQTGGYKRFVNIYSEYISQLFDEMTRNVPVDNIIVKLQDYKALKLGDLRDSLVRMLEAYFFESTILKDARDLVVDDTFENVAELFHQTAKGTKGERSDVDSDLVDHITIFDCGHAYPSNYLPNHVCPSCSQNEALKFNIAKAAIFNFRKKNWKTQNTIPEPLFEDRNEVQKEHVRFETEGTFPHSHKEEKKEKYLRKLMIIEQKRVEAIGDWGEFATHHHFY